MRAGSPFFGRRDLVLAVLIGGNRGRKEKRSEVIEEKKEELGPPV
jgi:hypothetical protein